MGFNPYSVLTPPGGFLYFPKINNLLNISLFTACKNNKIFDFIRKRNIMRDAVRVNPYSFLTHLRVSCNY